ncbi:MAG: o-succinylbenzoate--CoA ligase [Shewanella sp.]
MISPLHQTANEHPNLLALASSNGSISYRQLSAQVLALGQSLRQAGLGRGCRLGVISHNSLAMVSLYWACIDEGIVFMPISPRFPPKQINQLLQRFAIDHIYNPGEMAGLVGCAITPDFNGQLAIQAPNINSHQAANVILTSGSSGQPKAAVHSLANHIHSAQGSAQIIPLHAGDRWLLSLPLFHIGGLAILNRCAIAGACVQLMSDEPLSLQVPQVSHVSLVATQLQRLVDNHCDLSRLKAMLLGGGAISSQLQAVLAKHHIQAFCSYGMTEMSSQICTGQINNRGLSGRLLPERQLDIRDGIIWVKGATLFLGYLSDTGLALPLDPQGWFCTNDCGHWSDDGQLTVTGRSDNMFICGGENIQPEEIEALLTQLDAVSNAIVFPVPNHEFGLLPAAIIRWAGDTRLSQDELNQAILPQLAQFKRPRQYWLWPEDAPEMGIKVNRQQVIALARQAID